MPLRRWCVRVIVLVTSAVGPASALSDVRRWGGLSENGSKACSRGHSKLQSRDPRIALLGATGTIGTQIAELIGQRNFPYAELKLFARDSSADRMVDAGERSLPVAPFNGAEDLSSF